MVLNLWPLCQNVPNLSTVSNWSSTFQPCVKMVLTVKCWMENADMANGFYFFYFFNIKNVWRNMTTQILIKKKKAKILFSSLNFIWNLFFVPKLSKVCILFLNFSNVHFLSFCQLIRVLTGLWLVTYLVLLNLTWIFIFSFLKIIHVAHIHWSTHALL